MGALRLPVVSTTGLPGRLEGSSRELSQGKMAVAAQVVATV